MKTIVAVFAMVLGTSLAHPAKLDDVPKGYNYKPPAVPSGLYNAPPPVPSGLYSLPPPQTPEPVAPAQLYEQPLPTVQKETVLKPVPEEKPSKAKMLMPYEYKYAVNDEESGTQFSQNTVSDGEFVQGQYSVLLPDGRVQIVKYTSDPINGFQAEISYE